MVRLELHEAAFPRDAQEYLDASLAYSKWLDHGILTYEQNPSFYLLRQDFSIGNGNALSRYSLIGALRLEELGKGVKPHENTGVHAKNDRMVLMESTSANFSPLFMLFSDEELEIKSITKQVELCKPIISATLPKEVITVWRIDDTAITHAISSALSKKNVYIADGHHRYETSLEYSKKHSGDFSQYVMTALVSFDDPGLQLLPYNRLISGLDEDSLSSVRERLLEYFDVLEISVSDAGLLTQLIEKEGEGKVVLALIDPTLPYYSLLTSKPNKIMEFIHSKSLNPALHEIEAWVLQEVILRPVLEDSFDNHVSASHDTESLIKAVESKTTQMGFLLKGIPLRMFERIVNSGVKLPRKSTYFWPKLPSGLIIKNLED